MKPFNFIFFPIFLFLFQFGYSQNKTFVVRFDDNCMEKLEYQYKNNGKRETEVHIRTNKSEKLILFIDNTESRRTLPRDFTGCGQIKDAQDLVFDINKGRFSDFSIYEKTKYQSYIKHTVKKAAYLYSDAKMIDYRGPEMSFVYNYQPTGKNQDLALKNSELQVFFEKRQTYNCPSKLKFFAKKEQEKSSTRSSRNRYRYGNQKDDNETTTRNDLEFLMVSGIGIIKKVMPPEPPKTNDVILTLDKINGNSAEAYMREYCEKGFEGDIPEKPTAVDTPVKPDEFDKMGGRIYKDTRNGLFIDRATWKPANVELENFVYVNGKRYQKGTSQALNAQLLRDGCQVALDLDRKIYINLETKLPFDGACGGVLYSNGKKVSTIIEGFKNNDPNCTYYRASDGLYYDESTDLPATMECDGFLFINGVIKGVSEAGTNFASTPAAPASTGTANNFSTPAGDCNRKSSYGIHIVQKGETLFGIARRYGLSIAQLRSWNDLSGSELIPCMELRTIAPGQYNSQAYSRSRPTDYNSTVSALPDLSKRGNKEFHLVKEGETVASIAQIYGCTAKRLREINGMGQWEEVMMGKELLVSGCNEPKDAFDGKPETYDKSTGERLIFVNQSTEEAKKKSNAERRFHTVRKGDTLYGIAKEYAISLSELRDYNNIKGSVIRPGQKIFLEE